MNMNINENLQIELEKQKINKMDLVRMTKIPKSTIYNLNKGTAIGTIEKIANQLNIDISQLINNETDKRINSLMKRIKQLEKTDQEIIYTMLDIAITTYEKRKFASRVHH